MNTPPRVQSSHAHVQRDTSEQHSRQQGNENTSPSNFLTGLNSFKVIPPGYKHYGHLMTSDQLEKLVSQPYQVKKETKIQDSSRSSLFLSGNENPAISPLDPPNRENLMRATSMSLDQQYGEETMREMIRLRVEQERTKQAQFKYELGQVTLQLLREAETHGFGGDLIRKLFLDESSDNYLNYIHQLRAQMSVGTLKRKYPEGDSVTPAPIRSTSTNKLPVVHNASMQSNSHFVNPNAHSVSLCGNQNGRRGLQISVLPNVGGNNANSAAGSASGSVSGPSQLPNTNMPVYQLHVFPVYYTQVREQIQLDLQKQSQQHEDSESLGLPYTGGQKYPAVVFYSPPQQLSAQSQQQQHQHQVLPGQCSRPYYTVNSLTPGMAPGMASQYFIPPRLPSGMGQWGAPAAPVLEDKKHEEETHHHKRQRGNKNSINFMITTPKNPPAKKYNKS